MLPSRPSFENHGGINPSELRLLGFEPGRIIDFSVNSNPFGPAPVVLDAIRNVDISKYPDRYCAELISRLADANQVKSGQILTGNGTAELIWLLAQTLINPDDPVIICGPTFGEYARALRAIGASIKEIKAEPPDFRQNIDTLNEEIRSVQPRLVFLCNPNNPTGTLLPDADIHRICIACGIHTTLVLDEAYRSFTGKGFFGGCESGNIIYLRSMTKDFALAGLRLGYVIAQAVVVQKMKDLQPTWSVNALAQAAGLAVLENLEYYQKTLDELAVIRENFFQSIATITQKPVISATHYCVIPTHINAGEVRRHFLQHFIQVRDCTSFGMPQHIRVSTQLPENNRLFVDAFNNLVQTQGI